MRTVSVGLGDRCYDVAIGDGAIHEAGTLLAPFFFNQRAIVVSDETVAGHWLEPLVATLGNAGIEADPILLPPGEDTKNWDRLEDLVETLIARNISRDEHIVALGGGVAGDIAGFAAAIVKRGCGVIQIPTSLLAQVDSSVGGKTAINSRHGKNLIGAFHQPGFVLIDPAVLATLPDRHMRAGYAELVKYGLIGDADFFDWCEQRREKLLARDAEALTEAIAHAVAIKARIVAEDETERSGKRMLLNLGHTFGHALEAETGFSDTLLHGEAVAAGMALAFRFSAERGLCGETDAERVVTHLQTAGLPATLAATDVQASGKRLAAHMAHDKKRSGETVPFILAKGIGEVCVDRSVDLADVAAFLDRQS